MRLYEVKWLWCHSESRGGRLGESSRTFESMVENIEVHRKAPSCSLGAWIWHIVKWPNWMGSDGHGVLGVAMDRKSFEWRLHRSCAVACIGLCASEESLSGPVDSKDARFYGDLKGKCQGTNGWTHGLGLNDPGLGLGMWCAHGDACCCNDASGLTTLGFLGRRATPTPSA